MNWFKKLFKCCDCECKEDSKQGEVAENSSVGQDNTGPVAGEETPKENN